jgi:hypothetical protein
LIPVDKSSDEKDALKAMFVVLHAACVVLTIEGVAVTVTQTNELTVQIRHHGVILEEYTNGD